MRRETDSQTGMQTDTQTAVANIHFASAMPHTKRNKGWSSVCGCGLCFELLQCFDTAIGWQQGHPATNKTCATYLQRLCSRTNQGSSDKWPLNIGGGVARKAVCLSLWNVWQYDEQALHGLFSSLMTDSMDFELDRILWAISVFDFGSFVFCFFLVLCARLCWLGVFPCCHGWLDPVTVVYKPV